MTSITTGATNAPPRPVAGVAIPDSRLAWEITELVRDTASPLLFDHSRRVLHWSALTGVRRGLNFDAEPLYTSTMSHDMGPTPQYRSADERFEVDGANAARLALLHGSTGGSRNPQPHLRSSDADGVRASQLQHPVQDMNGDADLGRPPLILARAQPVPNDLLVAPDGGLNAAPFVVAGQLPPPDPAFLYNALRYRSYRLS